MHDLKKLHPRRMALIKPSALGDIVHALPVLTALRERFPTAHITWVVNSAYESLLQGHPHLNATLGFNREVFRQGICQAIGYSLRFARELQRRRFDLVIDLQGLLRTGLMCLATGAPRRVGFANAREGSRYAYTHRIRVPDAHRIHAVDRYWRVAEALGVNSAVPKRFIVPLQPSELAAAKEALAGCPRPWLAFAVGARWATKRWPTEYFANLASRAQSLVGGTCFFVGSREDVSLSQQVIGLLKGQTRDFTGHTTLPRLAALLSLADVMIANDTGPLHLAAALGTPCIAPYTCTRTVLHGPYSSPTGGVETRVSCRGSYIKHCDSMICMTDLTPDRLWEPLMEALHRWQSRYRSA